MCQYLDMNFVQIMESFLCLRERLWPGCLLVSWMRIYLSAHLRWVYKIVVAWKAVNINNCFGMWFIFTLTFLFSQSYLETFAYSNAEQDDLWRHFQMVIVPLPDVFLLSCFVWQSSTRSAAMPLESNFALFVKFP